LKYITKNEKAIKAFFLREPMMEKRHQEYQYLDLLQDVMDNGSEKKDHNTGMPLRSVFQRQSRYDLSQGFPLLTTKKVFWKGIVHELYWFMSGQTNIKYLEDNGCGKLWTDYPYKVYKKASDEGKVRPLSREDFGQKIRESPADSDFVREWGELPHIYGEQWRAWSASDGRRIDQLAWVVDTLKNFPDRKHALLSAWNPEFLYAMAKPGEALNFPLCHVLFHFDVADGKLSCGLYQRSCDAFLGVPFNLASYALLTKTMAQICGYEPGEFIQTYGDFHVYSNHFDQVKEQLTRTPRPFPRVTLSDKITSLDSFRPEHVTLEGYDPHPALKGELTVAGGFDEKDRTSLQR